LTTLALGFGCSRVDHQSSEAVITIDESTLAVGRPIEIPIDGEGVHLYSLQSTPGQALRLVLDAHGNDVRVKITTEQGQVIRETPGNGHTWGVETVSFRDPREGKPSDAAAASEALTLLLEVVESSGSDAIRLEFETIRARPGSVETRVAAEELLTEARSSRGATLAADLAAIQNAQESAEAFKAAADQKSEAIAVLEVVSICIDRLNTKCIQEWARRGLELAEAIDNPRLIDQAVPPTALAAALDNDRETARALFDRSVAREERTTTVRHQARNQIFLSFFHNLATRDKNRTSEERTESIRLRRAAGERSLELFEQAGDLLGAAEARASLHGYTLQLGDFFKSLEHAQKLEEVLDELPDNPRGIIEIYNSLGVHYRSMGDPQRSLEFYSRGAEIIDRTGFIHVTLLSNLGRLNLRLGDIDAAIALHKRVLPHAPSEAANDLGRCYLRRGRSKEALASFQSAIDQSNNDNKRLAWGLDGLALAKFELGHYEEAIETLERSLELHRSMQIPLSEAYTLRALAEVSWREGDLSRARGFVRDARRIFSSLGDNLFVARADELIGAIEHSAGNLQASLESFERAAATYEEYRFELEDLDRRANFFASRQDTYLGFIDLLADLDEKQPDAGYAQRAFEVSERAKARSLVDMLRSSRWDPRIEEDSELFAELRSITNEVTWLRKQIEEIVTMATPDPTQLEALRLRVDALQAERERVWGQIRVAHPRYAELTSPRPASMERIQDHLSPNTALLQFALGEEKSYLFVVTDEDLQLFPLAINRESIQRNGGRLSRDITQRRSNETEFVGIATKLYEHLIEPAAAVLASRNEWIVVPDGPLYTLPFEALMAGDSAGGQEFLIEQASIHYVPSATTLVTLKGTEGAQGQASGFVAFADSLPKRPLRGAREEVERIMSLIPSELTRAFIGDEATEEAAKTSEDVRSARWLHFATHGEFDASRPESSGIVLSTSLPDQEGRLTSQEILELKLSADLVVLSGCQTGLGKQIRGEGIIVGLTRAFMYAGAQSLAVSLWKVEDRSTAELMVHFYGAMLEGENRADALRAAKLELIRSEQWKHPFFWAPFVLVGPS